MFIQQGFNRKQIAEKLNVREKTVGEWVKEGSWETLRTQRITSKESVITNMQQLIGELTEKRLAMEHDPKVDSSEKARLTDEISKQSKALSEMREEGEITLTARVVTMEWVFTEMEAEHPDVFNRLIDFQSKLLEKAAALHA